jgi:ferredoxin-like protein FixX
MLSDTDAGKCDADVEEGEIGEDADAAVEEAAEGSREKADLAKARTCYIGRYLMTQADLDALRLEGCFEPGTCRLPGKETTPKPRKNESGLSGFLYCWASATSIQEVCGYLGGL